MKLFKSLIISAVVMYLIGAFAQADFNIKLWNESARGFVAVIYGLIALVLILTKYINLDEAN